MRPMISATRSPDGLHASGAQARDRFASQSSDNHRRESASCQFDALTRDADDNYDDGLVHNHVWATATGGR
jgi:hypothetical protein